MPETSSAAFAIPKSASFVTPSSAAQEVAGLDVAVHDAVAVGVLKAQARLRDDRQGLVDAEVAVLAQELGARLAADVLHDEVVAAAGLVHAEVEDLDDVRVDELGDREGLAAEARDELLVVGQVLGQQLHGDLALEAAVEGEVDRRHPADAQASRELVAPGDHLPGHHGELPVPRRRCPRCRGRCPRCRPTRRPWASCRSGWCRSAWCRLGVVSVGVVSVGVVSVGVVSVGVVSVGVVSVGVVSVGVVSVGVVSVVVVPAARHAAGTRCWRLSTPRCRRSTKLLLVEAGRPWTSWRTRASGRGRGLAVAGVDGLPDRVEVVDDPVGVGGRDAAARPAARDQEARADAQQQGDQEGQHAGRGHAH